ncbi:MAG: ATP-binding protein [Deltaproteobacteria bacterium]|nr:ATP-binding protein [Deltaproteobacteria bacterium]
MRNLQPSIERDLEEKFVLLSGPRQVGKTHLAKSILQKVQGKYYNWDLAEDRQAVLAKNFLTDRFVVLDELHKYDRWKSFLKGVYDKYHSSLKVLVTGSARMDIYRKGGDSLLGRYFLFHLHPLSMGEILSPSRISAPKEILEGTPEKGDQDLFEALLKFGGFPEPFYKGSEQSHARWSVQRNELLVREDIRDLTNISLLSLIEHLLLLLPDRVGSILSVNALKEDLRVAYNTVQSWLNALENLYLIFILRPYTQKLSRAIQKEKKLYLWDWSQVKSPGARFENLIAGHLWKAVQIWRDLGMGNFELSFLRDRDRREVDFLITEAKKPWLLVEAKWGDSQVSESLDYFANRLQIPAVQLIGQSGFQKQAGRVQVCSADRWLRALP